MTRRPPPSDARSRLRSLLRRRELVHLARELRSRGASGWIVGGAPRDLLLGLDVPDVDVAVEGDPFELARALEESGVGTAVPLSEAAPRVARLAGAGRELDIAGVEGAGIETDLARRDFTVNAIAVAITPRLAAADALWIDPRGGVADLAEGRLRMVSEANLRNDPLRAWRAARLFATRGLVPDRPTTAACARAAPLLSTAAPERLRVELDKLLAARRCRPALLWAAGAGLLGPALGLALDRTAALQVLRRSPLDAPPLLRRPAAERVLVRLALLAARSGMDGPGAASWLVSRRFPRSVAREVGMLLALADRAARRADLRSRWGWVRDAGGRAPDALVVSRLLHPSSRAAIEAHARAARSRRRPPSVRGEDVLAWLGIPPGPEVGEWLREIEVEGLRGRVSTRREARRWLVSRRRAGSVRTESPPPGYNSAP